MENSNEVLLRVTNHTGQAEKIYLARLELSGMVRHSEKHLITILHPSSLSHNNHLKLQVFQQFLHFLCQTKETAMVVETRLPSRQVDLFFQYLAKNHIFTLKVSIRPLGSLHICNLRIFLRKNCNIPCQPKILSSWTLLLLKLTEVTSTQQSVS